MRLSYASPGTLRGISLALSLWLAAASARAHAPEARNVALTPDGSAVALALPGFGLLWRAQPTQPFVYVCGALLGALPSAAVPSVAFFDDGTALWGSPDGLRVVARDGCPHSAESELYKAPVIALAIAQGAPQLAYAVVAGDQPGLWRSMDGGAHWELRAALATAANVTALVVSSSDPSQVALSETGAQGTLLRVSSEGGANLATYPQDLPLTLLHVRGGSKPRLWAMARDALTVGNRGRAILRAESPSGPWQTPLRVAYFGGLAIDRQGTISIGDEIGAMYESDDDGESFRKLPGDVPVACLAQAGDARWACTPGTLTDPVLQRVDKSAVFSKAVALAEVDRLATCRPELEVERVCAAAWVEWQRDVLRLPAFTSDAGAASSAEDSGQAGAGVSDAGPAVEAVPTAPDAASASDAAPQVPAVDAAGDASAPNTAKRRAADCSAMGPPRGDLSESVLATFGALCFVWGGRRRRRPRSL